MLCLLNITQLLYRSSTHHASQFDGVGGSIWDRTGDKMDVGKDRNSGLEM